MFLKQFFCRSRMAEAVADANAAHNGRMIFCQNCSDCFAETADDVMLLNGYDSAA